MIHIDRANYQPDDEWLAKADGLTKQICNAPDSKSRFKIIDDNEKVWGEIKDFLLALSHRKCWYSEAKDSYNHLHVDHFRPKKVALGIDKKDYGGYWWLVFQWTNYRVCGGTGNVRKKDKFAVRSNKSSNPEIPIEDEIFYFLDPCEEEDVLKITFNQNGEVTPITNEGWDYERAIYTIEGLNLNFKLLKESRKEVWVECENLILETQSLMIENDKVPSVMRRGQIKEKIKRLKILVDPHSEFSSTAKACLGSAGLPWALQIAG